MYMLVYVRSAIIFVLEQSKLQTALSCINANPTQLQYAPFSLCSQLSRAAVWEVIFMHTTTEKH